MEKIIINTQNRFEFDALCKALEAKKVKTWADDKVKDEVYNKHKGDTCVSIKECNAESASFCYKSWYRREQPDDKIMTLSEFFEKHYDKMTVQLEIASYKVQGLNDKGFKVGCTEVTWEEILPILKARPNYSFKWEKENS